MSTYRQTYNAARKHYAPIFERIIREQFEALLLGNEPDIPQLKAALKSLHTTLGVRMAKRTKEQVLKRAQKMTDISRYEIVILQYLERMGLSQLAEDITDTTREQLRAILLQQAEQQLTTSQVMTLIEAMGLPRWRGELIARTETSHAANVGAMVGALDTGLKCKKEWISAKDNRTRREPRDQTDHLHMDGVQVEMDANFEVPSKMGADAMLHPGQPGAPANQVCNCFLPDQLTSVDKSNIKKVFRSSYNGDVVTIHLSNEKSFTCTTNHPILTTKGWINAGMITNSDSLINSDFINDSFFPNFKVNDSISTFEEVFNSLKQTSPFVRRSGTIMDFYGDGSTSDVDIVCTDGKLHNGIKFFKGIKENIFKNTNFAKRLLFTNSSKRKAFNPLFLRGFSHSIISTLNEFNSILMASLAHSKVHAFASIPLDYSEFNKSICDNTPRASEMFSKFFDTESGIIKGFNFVDGDNCTSVRKVDVSHYDGFVYTFETIHQMYDVNSIVAKNCRCSVGFIPQRNPDGKLIKLAEQPPLNGNVAYLYQALNNATLLQIQQAVSVILAG